MYCFCSLPADVLWGLFLFVTHSNAWRTKTNPTGRLRGGYCFCCCLLKVFCRLMTRRMTIISGYVKRGLVSCLERLTCLHVFIMVEFEKLLYSPDLKMVLFFLLRKSLKRVQCSNEFMFFSHTDKLCHAMVSDNVARRGTPMITFTGMYRSTGSWFWSSWFRTGYSFQRRFLERI